MTAKSIGRTDPDRAGQMRARAADGLLVGDDGRFHRFRAVSDALASFSEQIPSLAPVKKLRRKVMFEPVDTPDHCGMIDTELFCGSGDRSAAHDSEHKAEVVPVDRAALIQHFRTSMVQYLGLVSQEMQVKKA